MSYRVKRNLTVLEFISKLPQNHRRHLIEKLPDDTIIALAEILKNELAGNVKLGKKACQKLKQYKTAARCLICKKISVKKKRKILTQNGGLIPAAVLPILSIAASLFATLIQK